MKKYLYHVELKHKETNEFLQHHWVTIEANRFGEADSKVMQTYQEHQVKFLFKTILTKEIA
jgi:hypothetical protein